MMRLPSRLHHVSKKDIGIASSISFGVGAVLLANYATTGNGPISADADLSVMTWNVLARPYTKYNAAFHNAPQVSEKKHNIEEETSQTVDRYTMAGNQIVGHGSDIVFLQECEADFFNPAWNKAAKKLLEDYSVFPCRMNSNPGTAILVKKAGSAAAAVTKPVCIGGTKETGGPSKIATVLPVRYGSRTLKAVSGHFAFDGAKEKRSFHFGLLEKELDTSSVILGGDFNCQPGANLEELEGFSFLHYMQRAKLPQGIATGLNGNFSERVCIDHIYFSNDFLLRSIAALDKPRSPWVAEGKEPGKVTSASDHVPVVARLVVR
eukprot:TRINITY_DN24360_c0_g1_i1.p1 TRINITY_DN24360_c0_g1~~TRINITY_DN24360_c0_g1_i1.p1  ORF type:complete len:321 (-),score=40.46 TRINITY_DN24360_c0_g1_i1:169-1131(-)